MDKQPTDEQIREFWEWCGFKIVLAEDLSYDIYQPDGEFYDGGKFQKLENILPSIDLNNLFKYAVPKIDDKWAINFIWHRDGHFKECLIVRDFGNGARMEDDTPALALFWAIWEVIKEDMHE